VTRGTGLEEAPARALFINQIGAPPLTENLFRAGGVAYRAAVIVRASLSGFSYTGRGSHPVTDTFFSGNH
jgi:hypothetical protein